MASLAGVQAWKVDDRIPPDTYLMVLGDLERKDSRKGDPQIVMDWRVAAGEYRGAEQRDWLTLWGDGALGNVVQLLDACEIPVPTEEFPDLGAMADWLAKTVGEFKGRVEAVVRQGDPYTDSEGVEREGGPKIVGYRKPGPGSDVDNDSSGFAQGPKTAASNGEKPPPF